MVSAHCFGYSGLTNLKRSCERGHSNDTQLTNCDKCQMKSVKWTVGTERSVPSKWAARLQETGLEQHSKDGEAASSGQFKNKRFYGPGPGSG